MIKGPGGDQLRPADRRRRDRPRHAPHPAHDERRRATSRSGQYGYGKVHGYFGASNERVRLPDRGRAPAQHRLQGAATAAATPASSATSGCSRALPAVHDPARGPDAGAQARLLRRGLERDATSASPTPTCARTRNRRYRASRSTGCSGTAPWSSPATTLRVRASAFTVDAAVYRHDFARTWRKVNRMGDSPIAGVARRPAGPTRAATTSCHRGARATRHLRDNRPGPAGAETIFIGPNQRAVRLAGRAGRSRLARDDRAGRAPRRGRRALPLRPHRSPAQRGRLPDDRRRRWCRDGQPTMVDRERARLGTRARAAR